MKIDFSNRNVLGLDTTDNWRKPSAWSDILRMLKNESGIELYDDSFEQWALSEWGIKFLHDSLEYPSHLTGVELEESTLTMLLLKSQR